MVARDEDTQATVVDLGDDLLETTVLTTVGLQRSSSSTEIEDDLASAKILINEGLWEEAKKVLRRIILKNPSHVAARKKLEEVHQLELSKLFSDTSDVPSPRESKAQTPAERVSKIDSEAIMRKLDRDLGLGALGDGDADEAKCVVEALFGSSEAMEDFAEKLDVDLAGLSSRDRTDVGIAFLEMGLYALAARQFEVASRDPVSGLPASALRAQALILAGSPFEATLCLEPILGDADLEDEDKIHFIYLMGAACEKLRKRDTARARYLQVYALNPGYRDVAERVHVLS